jgi:MtrB/PioB family decaheme-associated outer membrane protein
MNANTSLGFRLAPIAAALLAVTGSVHAAEGDLKSMITPDSSIEVGGGYVDSDNGNFGKYNGLNEQGGYILLDGDVKTRDNLSGTWTRLRARNLGLDNRELRWEHNRQGNWGYYLEYNEIPRNEPLTVTTPVVGIGGPSLTCVGAPAVGCPGGVSVPVDIESERKRYSLGFDKMFTSNWGFKVDFRNETKKGERIFGMGGPANWSFTPEPFDSTIRLMEATARFTDTKFQIVGGFYGTQYRNELRTLTHTYGAAGNDGTLILNPLVLPPDNQSYQLYVTGGYSFNPTTRGTFKAAYTVATQDDAFIEPTINGRTDLGGKVETTLLQAGISARPMPKLSILGNLRYEDRNDKTPVVQYFLGSGTTEGFNEPRSFKNTYGKLEASYALPQGFRAIGALEYDKKERNTYQFRSVGHRDETEEWSYRAEVRRAMSETVTGGLSYTYSDRDGSDFIPSFTTTSAPITVQISPLHYADRKREKVRLSLNWMPVAPLSVQFYVDDISDRYNGQFTPPGVPDPAGPRKGEQQVYAIDAAYQFSKDWQATAWYNYNNYKYSHLKPNEGYDNTSTNKGDSFGVGVRGKPISRLEVGADYSYSDIEDEWLQNALPGFTPLAEQLPIATTRLTRLKLFGKYRLDKHSGLRLDYIYDRYSSNDPTWTGWVPGTPGGSYYDGTVVAEPSPQKVHFVGVRYFYNF